MTRLAALALLLIAAPAHAEPCDARGLITAGAAVLTLASGGEHSIDVAIRDGLARIDAQRLGPKVYSTHLLVGVGAFGVAMVARGDVRYLRSASIVLSTSLATVVVLKALTGRHSAYEDGSVGEWRGPSWPPRGWPSGHVATTGALLFTAAELADTRWARAAAWLGVLAMSATVLAHEQHFASDVVASIAISAYAARRSVGQCRDRVALVPAPGGIGVAVGLR